MTDEQPISTTPEVESATSYSIGVTGSECATDATIGFTETSRQPGREAGFASEACGTFQTQQKSLLTDETPTVRSEVPRDDSEGTNRVPATDCGASGGNQDHQGTEANALRPRPERVRRRARQAHWRVRIGETEWRFAFQPDSNVITIRKRGQRKANERTITMPELIEALAGQKLLPI